LLALTLALLLFGWTRSRMASGAREGVYPFENAVAWLQRHAWVRVAGAIEGGRQRAAVRDLETEVARLRLDLARLERVAAENRELRQQLAMAARQPGRLVACPVLARDGAGGWWRQLRVGRGSRHGLAVGQAVLSGEGLVGRIAAVSPNTADVLLISDPNSRVACELDPAPPGLAAVRGVLYGGGARGPDRTGLLYVLDPLRLRYLDRDVQPAPRTRVLTSGLGDVPRGLLVGYLLASEVDAAGLYRVADVMPAADLSSVSLVFARVEVRP
jgi:rod shape-determining protein MreC